MPPEWHDVTLYFSEVRLHAAYSFTDWLAIDLLWSLRVVVQRFVLEDLATRMPIASPFGIELHHRNETLVGLTDPWLSLRGGKQLGPWSFIFRAGLTFPVGATVPNPFELAREGKEHEHIQFGTGTFDPFVEVELRRVIGHFTVSADLLGNVTLYQNTNGYRAGDQLAIGLHELELAPAGKGALVLVEQVGQGLLVLVVIFAGGGEERIETEENTKTKRKFGEQSQ